MPKLIAAFSMSLDGFVAGPDVSVDLPMGRGGENGGSGRGGGFSEPGPPGSTATATTSVTVAPCGGSFRSPRR